MRNLYILIVLLLFTQCNKNEWVSFYIYKTKGDYYYLVDIQMSEDKKKITSLIGGLGDTMLIIDSRVKLINGYIKSRSISGMRTVFLSLTYGEYCKKFNPGPVDDSLYKYILDKDPFTELYLCEDGKYADTASLNDIIRKGELAVKFQKVKSYFVFVKNLNPFK